MTDNKDNAPKSPAAAPAQPAKPADPKRPHATIDLKAIEVLQQSNKPAAQPVDPVKPAEAAAKPTDPKIETKPVEPKMPAAQSPPPVVQRKSAGIGSAITHLVAGAVGGAMAWYGVTTLAPQLGLPGMPDMQAADGLKAKLAALEKSLSDKTAATTSDLSAKLKAAEEKLSRIDAVNKTVTELNAAHAKLAAESKALGDKLAAETGADGAAARLAKLEEQLKLMTTAAAGDPQAGKLPQIAAVSGRLVDLEATLTNQLSALRKTVSQEMEQRLSMTNETSEAAKSGTNRIDRELATVKSDAAAAVEKSDKLRADTDRLTSAVQGLRDDNGTLKTALEGIKSNLDTRFKEVSKPIDVANAVAPVAGKLTSLEQNVQAVVKSEAERKTSSERILLALELNNLKRVLDRGQPYAAELAGVTKAASGKVDLTILERYKDTGIATTADLARDFGPVSAAIIDAATEPAQGSLMDRMMAGAKSVIRVRKISYETGDKTPEAIAGRMENAVKDGRMMDVLAEAKNIPAKAQGAAQDWLVKVEARAAVERAIGGLEAALKSSIAGVPAEAPPTPPAQPSKG